jgi:uncharacterized protein YndB with AHSA1/START domain
MNKELTDLTIRKRITIDAPPERAFAAFTERIGEWWPLGTHSIGGEDAETAAFEGRVNGRLYERIAGGEEVSWGEVLVWEPPHRLVFTWHPSREPQGATEVEVRFSAEGSGTVVELEHRGWEALGERATEASARYDTGWDFVLREYAKSVT